MKRLPIGLSDFKTMIEENRYFIDKTLLIKEVAEGSEIILYPRPRRFGKTLNLSMIKYFYDIRENNRHLFNGLKIEEEESVMKKQGKHPVIYITFKDIKALNYNDCMLKIKEEIRRLYNEHIYLLKSEKLNENEKEFYNSILNETANVSKYENSFKNLIEYLYRYYESKVVLLIDEYDMTIQGAYSYGYYDELILFIKNLLSGGLKDNIYLEKAVLTGILRVAKESIFSGLNNIRVASIISEYSADKFGFTEEEVVDLMKYYGEEDNIEEVKSWYNGYNFGGNTIYNPWSILNYADEKILMPYWVNTSGNDMIRELFAHGNSDVKKDLEKLIAGESLNKRVDDNIVYGEINEENTLWSFLLMSGYLKYENLKVVNRIAYADLRIPNEEVIYLYENQIIENWFQKSRAKHGLERVLKNLTSGDIDEFRYMFMEFSMSSFSYFDVSGEEPESFYHAFVLGMMVGLRDEYIIKSNKESGMGRYDILLIPRDKSRRGIIFEFKKVNKFEKESMETAMEKAKKQIIDRKYESELKETGIKEIVRLAAVFEGKNVEIESF